MHKVKTNGPVAQILIGEDIFFGVHPENGLHVSLSNPNRAVEPFEVIVWSAENKPEKIVLESTNSGISTW
jgi:hypothetical protein